MSKRTHLLSAAALLALLVVTRLPLLPKQLFSFDDVNFAWAIGKLDVRLSQPHPPGYPLFVLEMRVLDRLRFKNPRSNLLALSLLGTVAAVTLIWGFGERFWGKDAGVAAAWLLAFHPSFWYAGLTSAVRVHLAAVSLGVAWACYRAWSGDRGWTYWSALALALGAGVRPELGLLLLPLWLFSAYRSRAGLRAFAASLMILTAAMLAWLLPLALASGGPRTYLEVCWKYLADQAALTSPLFGAGPRLFQLTVCRLAVWAFLGVLAWTLPLALVARRPCTMPTTLHQWLFLGIWLVPALLFGLFVHVADAGQALTLVPGLCLVGGRLIQRALGEISAHPSCRHALIWMLASVGAALAIHYLPRRHLLLAIAGAGAAAGLALRRGTGCTCPPPRGHALTFLLAPSLFLNLVAFLTPAWYYRGSPAATGVRRTWDGILEDLHSGLSHVSLAQIRVTASLDDRILRAIGHLTEGHHRPAVILWEQGSLAWRKAAYYYPGLPVIVLDRKTLTGSAAAVVTSWRGPVLEQRVEGAPPLPIPLPPGGRLIWLVRQESDLPRRLRQHFPLAQTSGVYFMDLPLTPGELRIGDFLLRW